MPRVFAAAICALSVSGALANNYPPANPNLTTNSYNTNTSSSVLNNVQAGAQSGGNVSTLGNTQMYVLPAPVSAANLPAFNCPLGDSVSFSVGWNFFSYARSSIRTEMECLDRTLAVMKAVAELQVVPTIKYVTIDPAPAPAVPAPVYEEKFVVCPVNHLEQYHAWHKKQQRKKMIKPAVCK